MTDLSHEQKLRLIVKHYEMNRTASDGDSPVSSKMQALKKLGISRTKAYYIENGEFIKDSKKAAHFENVFRALVAAEAGSSEYRSLWSQVQSAVDRGQTDSVFDACVVPAAFGYWSDIALDVHRPAAERLLAGRMAQFVLYHYSHRKRNKIADAFALNVAPAAAAERGRLIIGCLVQILASNPVPPRGLFDHGSEASRELGYRIFRTRLFADHTGWQATLLAQDADRASHFSKAYADGLATDLIWLHEQLECSDVAHPNHAFVLATHAGDWARAGEYGITLLKAFPALLMEEVGGLSPLLDDRTVWPGLAAMMAHRWRDIPTKLRLALDDPGLERVAAVDCIRRMGSGVKAGASYLHVLKMGV